LVFWFALDCSTTMPPDHVTKRVAVLKEHLGVANKRPETIALKTRQSGWSAQANHNNASESDPPVPCQRMSYAASNAVGPQ
jgi:hypothetical protein